MVQVVNEGFLLEGTAYFDRLNDVGAATGLVMLPGISTLSFAPKSDIKDISSKDKGYYGQVIASVAIPQPTELKVALRNGTKEGVALALMGGHSDLSITGGSVLDENVTAKLNIWVELTKRNLTAASVVVTNSAGSTTYIENTDYEINYALGMLRAIPGGAITDAQAIKVDFAHAAVAGWKVSGATKPQAKGRLILDGRNLINNKSVRVEIYRCLLTADGDFNMMADDVAEFSLSGRMETPAGKTEPFIIEQW